MSASTDHWMSAADAAKTLGVTRETLYAYVSRGMIRSQPGSDAGRERRYARDDVDRLRRRGEERRNPDKVAANALQWGMPVLESAITLIADGTLYYRGRNAVELARTVSVEAVASLIWTGRLDDARPSAVPVPKDAIRVGSKHHGFIARAQALLALASTGDPQAFDLRPDGVARTGWRILDLLIAVAGGRTSNTRDRVEAALASAWRVRPGGEQLLRAAMILCADHELNVSAFTARCVASAGSNPYAVVVAGLSALEGAKHGGSTTRVESFLAGIRPERSLRTALTERLRQGTPIDGFGHPLYHGGDPRAVALLQMLEAQYPRSPELRFIRELARAAAQATGERPNLDFALGAVSRVLGLPPASGLTLFAIGRTIGWLGHAIEQYALGQIIRPRAKYVGVEKTSRVEG